MFCASAVTRPLSIIDPALHDKSAVGMLAHIVEYFILGFLLERAVSKWPFPLGFGVSTIGIGMSYAISDEMHQYFVPGRFFQLSDVMLDSLGVLLGLAAWRAWTAYRASREALAQH